MPNQYTNADVPPGCRRCSRCKTVKPLNLDNFQKGHPQNGGFSHYCLPCAKEYSRSSGRRARQKIVRLQPETVRKRVIRKYDRNTKDGAQSALKYRSRWTEDEDAFLRSNREITAIDVGRVLNRSMIAVEHRRIRLGLTEPCWKPDAKEPV